MRYKTNARHKFAVRFRNYFAASTKKKAKWLVLFSMYRYVIFCYSKGHYDTFPLFANNVTYIH